MEHNKNSTNDMNTVVQGSEPFRSESTQEDEIDLRELLSVIWRCKLLIIMVTALFAIAAVIYAINQPNIYKSEALLAPAEQESGGGLTSLAGQFGGLASLAGVNLGGGGSNKVQLAIEVLKSRQFISAFIQEHDILPDLIAAESWDMRGNNVLYDNEIYNSQSNQWIREVEPPSNPKPSMQEAHRVFIDLLSATTDKETGMVRLTVQHVSPYVAKQWVDWLVADINLTMKERDVKEAKRSTEFLQRQLNQTEVADIREVLFKLIEEQTKTIMFAKVRDEYVFKTIDKAIVPDKKSKPNRLVIVAIGAFLGTLLSLLIVFLRYFIKERYD